MSDAVAAPPSAEASSSPTPDAPPTGKGPSAQPAAPKGAEKLLGKDEKVEAPKPPEKRKYRGRVDGEDFEAELSDEEAAREIQKGRAASKRMQEAAEMRKQVQSAFESIKKDPFAALKDPAFGLDLEALAEQRLIEKYQREMMPEEERKRLDTERQLKEYQAREEEAKKAAETQKQQEFAHKVYQETEQSFLKALDLVGADKDYSTLAEMVEIAKLNLDYGIELTPEQMASEVKSRKEAREGKAFGGLKGLKGDALVARLGQEVVDEVLRHSVTKLKGTPVAQPAPKASTLPAEGSARKMQNPSQWRRELGLK